MKSNFLRILSLILVLASLVSMFSIFAYADDSADENVDNDQDVTVDTPEGEDDPFAEVLAKFPQFELLYQRNFEEGWAYDNGMSWNDQGSFVDVDYEMTSDYYYNYFIRFTVGSSLNSYLQFDYDTANKVGAVLEFDIMSDDYCNIPGLMHFGTLGQPSANRENPEALSVVDGKIKFFRDRVTDGHNVGYKLLDGTSTEGLGDPTEAGYEGKTVSSESLEEWTNISDQWLHVAVVFDFTYGDVTDPETGETTTPEPDPSFVYDGTKHEVHRTDNSNNGVPADSNPTNYKNYFTMSIFIAPTDEYRETGDLYLVDTRTVRGRTQSSGEGISLMRIGTSGNTEQNWDTSVCFDNIVAYTGANEYGLATEAMGAGSKVNEKAAKVYDVIGGGDSKSDSDYITEGVALKIGVDYMRVDGQRVAIATDEEGNAVGAPLKDENGNVLIPLLPILDAMNYKYYLHEDGNYLDISTGSSSSYISVGKSSATVDGERVSLTTAPGYYDGVIYVGGADLQTIIPGKFVNYDDMGLVIIADKPDLLDRTDQLGIMLDIMKSFVFDYAAPEDIYNDVAENTNNFDHPYLLGDQDEYDWLRSVYNSEPGDENYDPTLKSYIEKLLETSFWSYRIYARPTTTPVFKYAYDENGDLIPKTDEDGNPVLENGMPVYETTDEMETEWVAVYDDKGVNVTHYVFDENGEFIPDENGNIPYVQAVDENGKLMFDSEGDPIYVKVRYVQKTDGEGNPVLNEDGEPVYELDPTYTETVVAADGYVSYVNYHTIVSVDADGVRTPMYLYEYRSQPRYNSSWDDYNGVFDDGVDYNGDGDAYELYEYHINVFNSGYYSSYSLTQPYLDTGSGYDTDGGRSSAENRTRRFYEIAFGWQMTYDVKYLLAAYDLAIAFGANWVHWGPGHFLNCADASAPFAYMFDMCYDGFVAIANDTGDLDGDGVDDFDIEAVRAYNEMMNRDSSYYDVKNIANILYEKGVYEGYISSNDYYTFYLSPIVGTGGSLYRTRTNNWNAVCSSGMIIAALSLLEFDYEFDFQNKGKQSTGKEIPEEVLEGTISDHAAWLISNNIENLATWGMDPYAPDGAYNEGPGYWSYGTNNFFELCMALDTATGQTYGLMDCWGIDTTCYYACQSESSDFRTFNYHDGAMGVQDTSFFFYAAEALNDPALAEIRKTHLAGGKSIYMYDVFNWPKAEGEIEVKVALDYYSEGIDLYAARSSWDKGALYIGIIGGANEHTHNQIDAGSFVYHNNGAVWFIDLGTENYNAKGFWAAATRYRYYVMKPEGNNTIAVTSDMVNVPWGQKLSGVAYAYEYETNDYGSYIKYEMTSTLGGTANTWQRAVMLTNNRKTTIIQDEITSNGSQSYYWFGHYSLDYVSKVVISDDGRTAYMYGNPSSTVDDDMVLRVSIVSPQTDLKFEDWDTYTFVHNDPEWGTYDKAWVNAQGPDENDRSKYRKLVIAGGGTSLTFNVAVVMELVEKDSIGTDREEIVEYDWSDIQDWQAPVEFFSSTQADEGEMRPVARVGEFSSNVNRARDYLHKDGTAFNTDYALFYRALTDAYYIYTTLGETVNTNAPAMVAEYMSIRDEFQSFRGAVIKVSTGRDGIINSLMGW